MTARCGFVFIFAGLLSFDYKLSAWKHKTKDDDVSGT